MDSKTRGHLKLVHTNAAVAAPDNGKSYPCTLFYFYETFTPLERMVASSRVRAGLHANGIKEYLIHPGQKHLVLSLTSYEDEIKMRKTLKFMPIKPMSPSHDRPNIMDDIM